MPKSKRRKISPPILSASEIRKAYKTRAKRAWATRRANAKIKHTNYALGFAVTGKDASALLNISPAPDPIRAQILDAAKALTMGDRNKLYGSPRFNLETQGELREAFWRAAGPEHQYTSWGSAMEMVLCKVARIASAPNRETQLNSDHVKDAINYLAISLEVA